MFVENIGIECEIVFIVVFIFLVLFKVVYDDICIIYFYYKYFDYRSGISICICKLIVKDCICN